MSENALVALIIASGTLMLTFLAGWVLMLRHRRRELQHREWMAALEKGIPLPEVSRIENGMEGSRTCLLRGLVWLACGLTLTVFLVAVWATSGRSPSLDAQIRQARELGYTEEQIRKMTNLSGGQFAMTVARPGFPLGLTFVGIVPAGIGIAYLVFYRVESRRQR